MKFYIDVDDTLADFRGYAIERGVPAWTGTWYTTPRETWTEEQHAIQAKTCELMERPDFWSNIPVLPGAFELVTACATRGETFLLTAYPTICPDKEMVLREKIQWGMSKVHFPKNRIIVCNRPEKIDFACDGYMDDDGAWNPRAHPNLLIDDAKQNIDEWVAAGGVALHCETREPKDLAFALDYVRGLK